MGFFGKLIKVGIDTALLPVAVVKDVATMCGALDENGQPHTLEKLKEIEDDIEEAKDEL